MARVFEPCSAVRHGWNADHPLASLPCIFWALPWHSHALLYTFASYRYFHHFSVLNKHIIAASTLSLHFKLSETGPKNCLNFPRSLTKLLWLCLPAAKLERKKVLSFQALLTQQKPPSGTRRATKASTYLNRVSCSAWDVRRSVKLPYFVADGTRTGHRQLLEVTHPIISWVRMRG